MREFVRVKDTANDSTYRYTKRGTIWEVAYRTEGSVWVQVKANKQIRKDFAGVATFEVDSHILEPYAISELEKAIYGEETT